LIIDVVGDSRHLTGQEALLLNQWPAAPAQASLLVEFRVACARGLSRVSIGFNQVCLSRASGWNSIRIALHGGFVSGEQQLGLQRSGYEVLMART